MTTIRPGDLIRLNEAGEAGRRTFTVARVVGRIVFTAEGAGPYHGAKIVRVPS